ncbi:chemotaxis protein CheW ['Osedax' symbiont bacterium Rs2_46_30_T18]|nr:chemotaxis protein CheW ['Osedax' symbiont bacterium Rs2_46_30_T18]
MQKSDSKKKSVKSRAVQEEIVFNQWATFKVNNELFAIDVMQVKEVLRYSEITPVPGSSSYIRGIINLRGNVVTVLDTRLLFSLDPRETDDDTRIIVVEYNEQEVVGMVVDSVDEVVNIPQNDIERAPSVATEDSDRRFVQGVSYYESNLIILLDLAKMLESITPIIEESH